MNPHALAGRRVVVTLQRPGRLTAELRRVGATVDHVPLTETREPRDPALFAALDDLGQFDWLIVTSVNGARHVGSAASRARSVKLAAVGSATAVALAELADRAVDLVPSVHRVEGLLAEFPRGAGQVLVAQGNLAGDRLADGLRSLGYSVTSVEAYTTVPRQPSAAELERLRTADVVVLGSGSAAGALAASRATSARLVAIGPSTATAAVAAGLTPAAVASSPAEADIVAAITQSLG